MSANRLIKINSQTHLALKKYSTKTRVAMGELATLFMKYGINLQDEKKCLETINKYKKGEIRWVTIVYHNY